MRVLCSVFAVAAIALAAGCRDVRLPFAPANGVASLVAGVNPDSIKLTYICGNRFRLRNANDAPAVVRWDIYGTSDSGTVTLPARAAATAYSETYVTSTLRGTMRVFHEGRLIQTKANGGTTCPVADVPAVAPDTVPFGLLRSLGTVRGTRFKTDYVREVIIMQFKEGTSATARAEAIGAVGGSVLGGARGLIDGTYYVRVPGAVSEQGLMAAAAAVRAMPGVEWVTPLEISRPDGAFLAPSDGDASASVWRRWVLDAANTTLAREPWALERVGAPWAWGCSTGDCRVSVAVVDYGLESAPDLEGNVVRKTELPLEARASERHGAFVASVLGAVGNNAQGITGMMWHAGLDLEDVFTDPITGEDMRSRYELLGPAAVRRHIFEAGMRGARVINLSQAFRWAFSSPDQRPDMTDRVVADRLAPFRDAVAGAIRDLRSRSKRPLVVIAAGNEGLDAALGGYALAKKLVPEQVLVVGGSDATDAMWRANSDPVYDFGTNVGPLVDLFAPAVQVTGLSFNSQPTRRDGTSFAAPLVSGAAGLLFTFNDSLTAEEVRSILIGSARHAASGIPLLDAYAALRLAATETGGPLCGNRVWLEGRDVKVQRGQSVETIATLPDVGYQRGYVNVFHGGRRIEVDWGSVAVAYDGATRSWGLTDGYPADDAVDGGMYNSGAIGWSHGKNTWMSARIVRHATDDVELEYHVDSTGTSKLFTMSIPASRPLRTCLREQPWPSREEFERYECVEYGPGGTWSELASSSGLTPLWTQGWVPTLSALAPQSNFGVVVLNYVDYRYTVGGYSECADPIQPYPDMCRFMVRTDSANRTELWRVDLARDAGDPSAWSRITVPGEGAARAGSFANWVSIAERGDELAWGVARTHQTTRGALRTTTCSDGIIQWLGMAQPSTELYTVSLPADQVCGSWYDLGGTTAPRRGGASGRPMH